MQKAIDELQKTRRKLAQDLLLLERSRDNRMKALERLAARVVEAQALLDQLDAAIAGLVGQLPPKK